MDTAKYSMNYEEEDTEALIESDIADSKVMSSVKKSREPNEADDKEVKDEIDDGEEFQTNF